MSNMDEFFNIEEEKTELEVLDPIVHSPDIKKNTLDDYHATRESMKTMITRGTDMLDSLIGVTKESESPRAYEVLAGYMKTITEMNKALMDIHKETKEITQAKVEETPKEEGDTYVYVGSTEDLQKHLDDKK